MPSESLHIAHAVDLTAYANGVVRRINALLTRADAKLFAELVAQLSRLSPPEFTVSRLSSLLASVRELNTEAYKSLHKQLILDLEEIAGYEAEFAKRMVEAAAKTSANAITASRAVSAAAEKPLRGRLMKGWADGLGQRRMQRIQDSLAIGYTEGRTVEEMVRALRGTKSASYGDGLLSMDRRDLEAVVRTAVGHYAQSAREAVIEANADAFPELVWVSTLDSRTSEPCRLRDGLRYTSDAEHKPIGHSVPWLGGPGRLHWNCRSTCIPAIGRPAERASVDGPVSGKLTYAQWLKKQPSARQDEILGPSRGRLMRQGRYSLDRFYNNKGRYLTLEELRKRDAETFRELGL